MIFTFLITIVFIAEIIIAISVILNLLRLDKAVLNLSETIDVINPEVKEICTLGRKISFQLKELSQRFTQKVKDEREKFLTDKLVSVLLGALVWKMNIKKKFLIKLKVFRCIVKENLYVVPPKNIIKKKKLITVNIQFPKKL